MGTTSIRRALALLTAGLLGAALSVPLAATAAEAASTCRIRNVDTGTVHHDLQAAIRAARHGHTLRIKGTCQGTARTGKSLTLIGIATPTSGRATLDGDGAGTVLKIKAGLKVRIKDLRIRAGHSLFYGGGIENDGRLVLRGRTIIKGNSADNQGGGIYNQGVLKLLDRSTIADNDAWLGGGIYNAQDARVVIRGSSSVADNEAGFGGGIRNFYGTVVLAGAGSIHHNTASETAGGIANTGGTIIGAGCGPTGNVHDNTPNDCQDV